MPFISKKLQDEVEAGLPENEFLTELQLDYLAEMQNQEYEEAPKKLEVVIPCTSDDTCICDKCAIPF